jgi:hypothetical protein
MRQGPQQHVVPAQARTDGHYCIPGAATAITRLLNPLTHLLSGLTGHGTGQFTGIERRNLYMHVDPVQQRA